MGAWRIVFRALTLAMAFVAGVALATLVSVFVVWNGDCPPAPYVCDAPGMAGTFLWIGLAPALGIVSAMAMHRWLSLREQRSGPRPSTEFLASAWPDAHRKSN